MYRRLLGTLTVSLGLAACGDSPVVEPEPGVTAGAAQGAVTRAEARPANAQMTQLHALPSAFHGALNAGDKEAIRALWAPDAEVWAAAVGCDPCTGPDEIADAIAQSGPFLNGWASLTVSYRARTERHGNLAEFGFECIFVEDGNDLTGSPVLAHLNATGTMRKVDGHWLFQSFQSGAGAL